MVENLIFWRGIYSDIKFLIKFAHQNLICAKWIITK